MLNFYIHAYALHENTKVIISVGILARANRFRSSHNCPYSKTEIKNSEHSSNEKHLQRQKRRRSTNEHLGRISLLVSVINSIKPLMHRL